MRADRLFFSGGSPTCSLPYVEAVVEAARRLRPSAKVNYDTNGFMTPEGLERILSWTTSVTFDLRAVDDEVHRAMTGAPSAPVLRNAKTMAAHKDQLWEFRLLVVPEINEDEVEPLCRFLADLDPDLPVCFLAFRPNWVLDRLPGTSRGSLERAVETAQRHGLHRAYWSGHPDISGEMSADRHTDYAAPGAQRAGAYAQAAGCLTHPRDCGACGSALECTLKKHVPGRKT
jgi:pyruvate formate lyase activating enzyme